MTTGTRVPATELTGLYGMAIKVFAKRMMGEVPDSIGVLWHQPAVLKDLTALGRRAEKWNALDPNLATYATMASAAYVGCSFCLDLHYFRAHDHGLDEAKAREVPRWRRSSAGSWSTPRR